jgi:hypothetical protein
LRLVLIGEILRADEPLLVLLADLLHTSGLLRADISVRGGLA